MTRSSSISARWPTLGPLSPYATVWLRSAVHLPRILPRLNKAVGCRPRVKQVTDTASAAVDDNIRHCSRANPVFSPSAEPPWF